jgi:hypothetical protein
MAGNITYEKIGITEQQLQEESILQQLRMAVWGRNMS